MRPLLQASRDFTETYELGYFLGQGTFAEVWECTEKESGLPFACKVIHKRTIDSPEARGDVERELHILQKLQVLPATAGRSLLQFREALESEENIHIVTELCHGGTLYDVITKHGPLPEPSAKIVFRQILSAVMSCHSEGILHRDIKPENILFVNMPYALYDDVFQSGSFKHVQAKLADFGLAVVLQPGMTTSGVVGNCWYTAPEVLQRSEYGLKADVWSLGLLLCFMLTGTLPFPGNSEDEIEDAAQQGKIDWQAIKFPGVSSEARHLASLMLQPWPWFRSSAAELVSHSWLRGVGEGCCEKDSAEEGVWRPPLHRRTSWNYVSMLSMWRKAG